MLLATAVLFLGPVYAVNYATEAPFIQQLGCQTIVLGPGSINQAHQPNEFLAHSEIEKTDALLIAMIQRYCLEA